VQLAALLLLGLIPAVGLFRIDLARGSLVLAGHDVGLGDFRVIAGLAIVAATGPLVMISTIGTLWCGWACPQNTVSEWANALTHRLLGSRADVNVESAGLRVAPSKNHARNWLALGSRVAAASLILGVIPVFWFFPPDVVWSLATFGESAQFSGFMYRLYLVSALAVFMDIAVVRHFLCNYACLYRFGTLLFRNDATLHVRFDATRAADCAKCNYCRVSCITGVDPTGLGRYDRCINCGECIDACNRLHARNAPATPGLLRFATGAEDGRSPALWRRALAMTGWHGALFAGGCLLLAYGLMHPAR
jgi:polyferredoxin